MHKVSDKSLEDLRDRLAEGNKNTKGEKIQHKLSSLLLMFGTGEDFTDFNTEVSNKSVELIKQMIQVQEGSLTSIYLDFGGCEMIRDKDIQDLTSIFGKVQKLNSVGLGLACKNFTHAQDFHFFLDCNKITATLVGEFID